MEMQKYILRFETQEYEQSENQTYDFNFDLASVYLKYYKHKFLTEEAFFFISLQDLDKKAQFLAFVDCSD